MLKISKNNTFFSFFLWILVNKTYLYKVYTLIYVYKKVYTIKLFLNTCRAEAITAPQCVRQFFNNLEYNRFNSFNFHLANPITKLYFKIIKTIILNNCTHFTTIITVYCSKYCNNTFRRKSRTWPYLCFIPRRKFKTKTQFNFCNLSLSNSQIFCCITITTGVAYMCISRQNTIITKFNFYIHTNTFQINIFKKNKAP